MTATQRRGEYQDVIAFVAAEKRKTRNLAVNIVANMLRGTPQYKRWAKRKAKR